MPGKRITDHQVLKYKGQRRTHTQAAAAAKAGISEAVLAASNSSNHCLHNGHRVSGGRARIRWRPAGKPKLLPQSLHLSAVTLLDELQRRYPGEYGPSALRTLQRRMRQWRAAHGREREVFFAQEHPPGRQGLSDFTDAGELGVTIADLPFAHRLYQFALAHSGWRSSCVVEGGKSFAALSAGLQRALWHLGGAPEEHRTTAFRPRSRIWATSNGAIGPTATPRCAHIKRTPSRNLFAVSHRPHHRREFVALWLHGKSNTLRAYGDDVGKPPRATSLSDLQRYADSLIGAPAARGRRLKTLKSLLSCATLGYLPFNAGAAIHGPALEQKLAERILGERQVFALLEAVARDHALIRPLYNGGRRVSELVTLPWPNLVEGAANVTGKGGNTRVVRHSRGTEGWPRRPRDRGYQHRNQLSGGDASTRFGALARRGCAFGRSA